MYGICLSTSDYRKRNSIHTSSNVNIRVASPYDFRESVHFSVRLSGSLLAFFSFFYAFFVDHTHIGHFKQIFTNKYFFVQNLINELQLIINSGTYKCIKIKLKSSL